MKLLIVAVLVGLCALVKPFEDEEFILSKTLAEDVEAAKVDVQTLSLTATSIVSQEIKIIDYVNDIGQLPLNEIYGILIKFEVLETDVVGLRNETDIAVITLSSYIVNYVQKPRNLAAASSLTWHHLNTFSLDTLSSDIDKLRDGETKVYYDMISIEEDLINIQKEFQFNLDVLTTSLTPTELSEITVHLNTMKADMELLIANIRMLRLDLIDHTNAAVVALEKIVDQLPNSE